MALNLKDESLYGQVSAKLNSGSLIGHIWSHRVTLISKISV